jgi:hypothetical protein
MAPDSRQASVLALRRSAHHHKLCVGKFDTHDPTLPLIVEVRADPDPSPGRAPDRPVPMGRLGHARLCSAPHDDTNASFRMKSQSFLHGARNCSESPDKQLCVASITASAPVRVPLQAGSNPAIGSAMSLNVDPSRPVSRRSSWLGQGPAAGDNAKLPRRAFCRVKAASRGSMRIERFRALRVRGLVEALANGCLVPRYADRSTRALLALQLL